MNVIKKVKWAYIMISSLMIILGILLIVFPEISLLTLCYALGILIVIFGIVKIISYFSKDLFQLAFQFDLAFGILAIVVGLLIFLHPHNLMTLFPITIGGVIFVDGVFKLQTAYDAKKFGMRYWWWILILAIVSCLCGLFLVFNLFGAIALTSLIGLTLIVDGIQNLWVAAYTVKEFHSYHNVDEEVVIDVDIKEK